MSNESMDNQITDVQSAIAELLALNKQLKQQLEKAKKERDDYYSKMTIANVRYTQEREKNKEAVEVIEFYGDINNWMGELSTGHDSGNVICTEDQDEELEAMLKDIDTSPDIYENVGGKRARQFLAKYRGEK